MRLFLSSLIVLFTANSALAEVPHYTCNYADITNIVSYDGNSYNLKARNLEPAEINTLEFYIDEVWDCDEGVELIGPAKTPQGAEYQALCSKDSLGTRQVELALNCIEDYLN